MNIYNDDSAIDKKTDIYKAFNDFIFSNDRDIFNKMIARHDLYVATHNLIGDIVECGVFKGSGLLTWLKMMDLTEPNTIKKVIGFDLFNPGETINGIIDPTDKAGMQQVFDRLKEAEGLTIGAVETRIIRAGFDSRKYQLVKGDISRTAPEFLVDKPGFRISILYLDMDIYEPTMIALENFWDRVVPGGYVVFDEYGYHNWSEANAADDFFATIPSDEYEIYNFHGRAPTRAVVKIR